MSEETQVATQQFSGWRFRLGLLIFVIGFISPLSIPWVMASGLSSQWKIFVSGALAVGIPEIFSIVAIAIMGKTGFYYMKARIFRFAKMYRPPDVVSRLRYRIGLVMFVMPIIFGWLVCYAPHLVPGYVEYRFEVNLVSDLMFLSSLVVLGGNFWDKVRALFIYEAKVVL